MKGIGDNRGEERKEEQRWQGLKQMKDDMAATKERRKEEELAYLGNGGLSTSIFMDHEGESEDGELESKPQPWRTPTTRKRRQRYRMEEDTTLNSDDLGEDVTVEEGRRRTESAKGGKTTLNTITLNWGFGVLMQCISLCFYIKLKLEKKKQRNNTGWDQICINFGLIKSNLRAHKFALLVEGCGPVEETWKNPESMKRNMERKTKDLKRQNENMEYACIHYGLTAVKPQRKHSKNGAL